MSLDNDAVFSYIRSGGSAIPLNSSDCKAFVDIEASSYLRDNDNAIDWYRLPLNGVELWINKDGPAAINRSAKITAFNNLNREDVPAFPVVDRNSVEDDVDLYSLDTYFDKMLFSDTEQNNDGFVRGRVWLYDDTIEEYKLTHHGYVGSYGPTSNSLLRKFWIYDVADLARDIPVGKEFENATLSELIRFVLSGTDDAGKDVGIEKKTPFTVRNVVFPSEDELASRTLQQFDLETILEGATDRIPIAEIPSTLVERASDLLKAPQLLKEKFTEDTKKFTRNRNNLVDVLNFIAKLIDGVWHFEPVQNGIKLHLRANWSDTDYGREFIDQTQTEKENKFTVTVRENTALSDIKPINTVSVNGESVQTLPSGEKEASGPTVLTGETFTESYPHAKLRYDPFYEAAGGRELGPTDVRSDATDLETAEKQAYEEFIAHVEETTEGRIELFGDPMPLPYDFINAVPACLGQQVANREPIAYSINDVHHKRYAGEQFVTELGVHAKVEGSPVDGDGSNFTIESEYKQT